MTTTAQEIGTLPSTVVDSAERNAPFGPALPHTGPRIVASLKVIEYTGLVLFTILVPRVMAPGAYGQFAAVLSLITLLVSASGMGSVVTFGRYFPEYRARGQWREARALFAQLFWTRAVLAAVMATALALAIPALLPGASPLVRVAAAGALLAGAAATTCYQLFLGLNVLGKWMAQDALTRVVLAALIAASGGASAAVALGMLLVTQMGFLAVGVTWTRQYFVWNRSVFDRRQLASHVSFGGQFFIANLLLTAVWRSGDAVVLVLSQHSEQAAFFNLANTATMTAGLLFVQIAVMLVPTITTLELAGSYQQATASVGYLLKYLMIGAVFVVLVVFAFGTDAIRIVLGTKYVPVGDSLRILVFGLPPLAVMCAGICRALVQKQPARTLRVNAGALVVFLAASVLLVRPLGAVGGALAVVLALLTGAAAAAWEFSLVPILRDARVGRLLVIGALAFSCFAAPALPRPLAGLVAMTVFAGSLIWSRLVTLAEVRGLLKGPAR